jgi:hypothetical protein
MNEADWLACKGPQPMLHHIRRKADTRKLRLFAVACCRRIGRVIDDQSHQLILELAERIADGLPEAIDLPGDEARVGEDRACWEARSAYRWASHQAATFTLVGGDPEICPESPSGVYYRTISKLEIVPSAASHREAARLAALNGSTAAAQAVARYAHRGANLIRIMRAFHAEREAQADLLRDIMGNPFRRVTIEPSLLTPRVLTLARTAYVERAFDQMPILGDELEEAGCQDIAILTHCREPIEHVRGCWVVDAVSRMTRGMEGDP